MVICMQPIMRRSLLMICRFGPLSSTDISSVTLSTAPVCTPSISCYSGKAWRSTTTSWVGMCAWWSYGYWVVLPVVFWRLSLIPVSALLKTPTQRGWQWNVMDISWLPTADVWLGKLWYYLTLLISHSSFCLPSYSLGEGCSHVAAIIFKIESAVRNGHTCCTSSLCHWNQLLQLVKALHTIRTLSMFAK